MQKRASFESFLPAPAAGPAFSGPCAGTPYRLGAAAMLARRFLWIVAGLTLLVMAGALLYPICEPQLLKFAMVPLRLPVMNPPVSCK